MDDSFCFPCHGGSPFTVKKMSFTPLFKALWRPVGFELPLEAEMRILMRRFCFCIAALFAALCWPNSGFTAQSPTGKTLHPGNVLLASAQEAPHMLLSETIFDFKEVLEGSVVSHDFIVWNTGNAVLRIDQVGPTCGCLKTDFDESIPPGGVGRITLTVDFADYEGPLERTVGVFSNDPDSDDATLSVKGTAKR